MPSREPKPRCRGGLEAFRCWEVQVQVVYPHGEESRVEVVVELPLKPNHHKPWLDRINGMARLKLEWDREEAV